MTEGAARDQSLAHAEEGADRLHRTLEQLLLLARVEGSLSFDDGLQSSAEEVARLAQAGFVHRDLHYNNLLLDSEGEIIWIDAHVRRLPRKRDRHWDAICRSLTVSKLRGEPYRVFVEQQLRAQLPA